MIPFVTQLSAKNVKRLSLVLIMLLAFWVRFYEVGSYPFGFDQVQIAREAKNISQGNLSLIGPRTGPANMFTGPLVYYIAAAWNLFLPSPESVIALALTVSVLSGMTLYWLGQRYLSSRHAVILLFLWAFSPFMISLDRVPWNPNLAFVAGALALFPFLKKSILRFEDFLLISLGIFLGYQAHFSGLLLLPLSILSLFLRREKTEWKFSPILVIGLLLSLLPTLFFDLRNNWLNTQGFLDLITNKDRVANYQLLTRFWEKGYIAIETLGKIFFQDSTRSLILVTGLAAFMLLLHLAFKKKEQSQSLLVPSFWILATLIAFSFYREETPEYYFLVLVPAFFVLCTEILLAYTQPIQRVFLLSCFLAVGLLYTQENFDDQKGLQFRQQREITNYILEKSQANDLEEIVLDMQPLDSVGLSYMLEEANPSLTASSSTIHVIYPHEGENLFTVAFSDTAVVWDDPRTEVDREYITQEDVIFEIPNTWQLLEDHSMAEDREAEEAYVVLDQDEEELGELFVYLYADHPELTNQVPNFSSLKSLQDTKDPTPTNWEDAVLLEQPVAIRLYRDKMYILLAQDVEKLKSELDLLTD